MKFPFVRSFLTLALAGLASQLSASSALAAEAPINCYRIEIPDTPVSTVSAPVRSEVWCYQDLMSPAGSTYIFNADDEEVRPEMALVIEPDGFMTHGSLLAGDVSVHKVRAKDFNPFSVPLEEPRNLPVLMQSDLHSPKLLQSAREVLSFLLSHPTQFLEFRTEEGRVQTQVAADLLPWRGYWWPYKNFPLSTPLTKYDRFVQGLTGTNPGAQRWEANNHRYKGIAWEGHCNGWAAASVLRREPSYAKRDPVTGVIFSIVDQKGILAETDYCASVAFFGKRYRGGRDDIRDIYPAEFHKVLTYYIGNLGKPVATDYKRDASVDNHIISGYDMDIQKTGTNRYQVSTRLKMHRYDTSRITTPGTAPEYTRTYRYTLTTDSNGTPIGGQWISTNPDFLWVPLSTADCNTNNPRVSHAYTARILDLPAAQ